METPVEVVSPRAANCTDNLSAPVNLFDLVEERMAWRAPASRLASKEKAFRLAKRSEKVSASHFLSETWKGMQDPSKKMEAMFISEPGRTYEDPSVKPKDTFISDRGQPYEVSSNKSAVMFMSDPGHQYEAPSSCGRSGDMSEVPRQAPSSCGRFEDMSEVTERYAWRTPIANRRGQRSATDSDVKDAFTDVDDVLAFMGKGIGTKPEAKRDLDESIDNILDVEAWAANRDRFEAGVFDNHRRSPGYSSFSPKGEVSQQTSEGSTLPKPARR